MNMEITLGDGRKVSAEYNRHTIMTDQPVQYGGEDTAPAPFDLFLASLGTCAGFYVKIFCLKRNIPTDNIRIIQTMEVEETNGMIGKIKIDIKLPPDFPEKYKDAVVNSANLCAVKKHIQNPPEFEVFASTI